MDDIRVSYSFIKERTDKEEKQYGEFSKLIQNLPIKNKILMNYKIYTDDHNRWLNTAIEISSIGNTELVLKIIDNFKNQITIENMNIDSETKKKIIKYIDKSIEGLELSKGFRETLINVLKENLKQNKYYVKISDIKKRLPYTYPTIRTNMKKIIKHLKLPKRLKNESSTLRQTDFAIIIKRIKQKEILERFI